MTVAMYVDGFVIPIPKRNLDTYRRMARKAGKVWMEYGALAFHENVADDLRVQTPDGPVDSLFPAMVGLKRGETVLFSYIVFRSRAHRDRVNAKVMQDPRLEKMMKGKMPFDPDRMAYAGFRSIVDLQA